MSRTLFGFLLVLMCSACGGEQPPPAAPPPPPAPTASEAASAAPAPSASAQPAASAAPSASAAPAASAALPPPPEPGQWDKWSHDQKLAYMKSAVMPTMGPLFHDFDAKAFSDPRCGLCHGAGAKDGTFKMPNPGLPKLPMTPDGFKKLHDQKPEVVEFMSKQVVPTMAKLVGEEPYDPKTKKGFGCFQCHTKK